jgi:hypothetical protein
MIDLSTPRLLFLFWKRASLWFVLILSFLLLSYFAKRLIQSQRESPRKILICVTDGEESLDVTMMREILGLNGKEVIPLHTLREQAINKGVFSKLRLSLRAGGKLYCFYRLRTPAYRLGNLSHMYLDEEGVCFPSVPFFSPKRLPEIFLPSREEYTLRENEREFLKELKSHAIYPSTTQIDLSRMESATLGEREIVIRTQEGAYFRLPTTAPITALSFFEKKYQEKITSKIYDLRIPNQIRIKS